MRICFNRVWILPFAFFDRELSDEREGGRNGSIMAVLQINTPAGSRVLDLPEGVVSFGRRSSNDVVIDDERASRKHCTIRPVPGGFLLVDNNSRNGTYVGDRRVDRETTLAFGEGFRIGKTEIRLYEDSAPPVVPLEPSETIVDTPAPVEVAELVREDYLLPPEEADSPERDRLMSEARTQLNNLRTAGTDPGFELNALALLNRQGQVVHAGQIDDTASPAVRILRLLFYGALRTRATDIHFEPVADGFQIRFRIDGTMLRIVQLPQGLTRSVMSVVKILADLDIAGREQIQDGTIGVKGDRPVDCRVSFTPTMHGEKLVVRLLNTAGVPRLLSQLGLPPTMLRQVRSVCHLDTGMMIVSGPTGSGKTTTLYTALRCIDYQTRNVVTIEDPIEYHIDGITQIPASADKGLAFHQVLRSVLRQDPDVILLGEIRDRDTAQTAMQAAMTGHLVFTTLHARDSIGSIFRLLDLGCEAYMIAHSVTVCLAQRLIRVLCKKCKRAYTPKPSQLMQMGMQNDRINRLYTHVGCRRCMEVGFWGRQAIFELLSFNDELRDALMTTKTIHDIRRAAGEWTYQSLIESGYRKVADGVTTIEEIERVAPRE